MIFKMRKGLVITEKKSDGFTDEGYKVIDSTSDQYPIGTKVRFKLSDVFDELSSGFVVMEDDIYGFYQESNDTGVST